MKNCLDLRQPAALMLIVLLMAVSSSAQASSGEHELWFGAGVDGDIQPSVHARYLYDQSDFWSIGGGVEHRLDGALSAGRSAALAELRMVIDALTFVPALSLVGGGVMTWPKAEVAGLLRLEASVVWRPARDWGVMLRIGAERQLVDQAATTMLVTLAWGRYLGGAADLEL